MGFGNRRPERRQGRQTWTYIPIPPGSTFRGWKAGDPTWVQTHYCPTSKPCREAFTDGELPCEVDHLKYRLDETGYFPFYDQCGRPLVCIVREYSAELIHAIRLHAPITITRGSHHSDPIHVAASGSTVGYHSSDPARLRPADIRDWLLTFWKDAELRAWWAARQTPGTPPAVANDQAGAKLSPSDTLKRSTEVIRGNLTVKPSDVLEGMDSAELFPNLVNRLKEATPNGKHPKKGGAK